MPDDKKVSELTEETSIVATDLFYLAKDLGGGVFGDRKMVADNIVPLTTKGDLLVHNTTVLARLPVGTDGFHLEADSGAGAGVSWAAELFTAAKDTKLTNIEALADVTDAANVNLAGAVMESDFATASLQVRSTGGVMTNITLTTNTIPLRAGAGILAFAIPTNTVLGRIAGSIQTLTATEIRTLINVESGSTADQTDAEIKTAYENNANTNEFSDAEQTSLGVFTAQGVIEGDFVNNSVRFKNSGGTMGNIVLLASQILGRKSTGEIDNLTAAETRTIINVENGATADQTGAEIKTAYEAEANAYTDALNTKLGNIETLADVTDATNVNNAGAVMETDFAANTLRFKNNASAMGNITVAVSQMVGRASSGEIRNLTATEIRTLINVENNADVTDTANVTSAGALMDSEVDADLKTLVLPANTTISAFGRTLIDDAAAINGRATLGVVIGTDVLPEIALVGQTEAETGTATDEKTWSAERVKQAIISLAPAGFTLGTPQSTSSGTQFDFTGIPAGVNVVIITFDAVSLSGTDSLKILLGDSGGFETSGYTSTGVLTNGAGGGTSGNISNGFLIPVNTGTMFFSGTMILTRHNTSHLWVCEHAGRVATTFTVTGGGKKNALTTALTQIRVTRTGSNNFDNGNVNIAYV